jgi:hypothetical protein
MLSDELPVLKVAHMSSPQSFVCTSTNALGGSSAYVHLPTFEALAASTSCGRKGRTWIHFVSVHLAPAVTGQPV